jgi:pyrroline-5-carboxylate reductase
MDIDRAKKIFGSIGKTVLVDEKLMDAVTGLSGSGPAYIFIILEALADAGVKAGIPRNTALKLAAQTCLGAAKLILETGESPAVLKDQVTSPEGTTICGIQTLEKGALRGTIMDAVEAAVTRSKELGKLTFG